jgi:glycosyltransferase involved in cell wall biosynthesis
MEEHVRRNGGDHVTTLLNGTDLDLALPYDGDESASLRSKHGLELKKVVLYAGTFGRANAIPSLIDAAERLASRSDIHFVFMGEGFYEQRLREAARDASNLSVVPAEPRHRIFNWFRMADLALVSFLDLPVLAANSPAKFFDSLASGTPVIVTNPGWTKAFVEKYRCGWYAPSNELGALVRCIEEALMDPKCLEQAGQRGQAVARDQFDRNRMAEALDTLLLQYAPPSGTNA